MSDPLNDGVSSVEIIDYLGSDLTVVNAARVSMAKESEWEPMKLDPQEAGDAYLFRRLSEKDSKLISYLAKHGHWTPFSQPQIQLRIKMPIFIARQWFKHQVGFTRNEVSRRYVSDTPELYIPKEWRARAENVKQGSSDETVDYPHDYKLAHALQDIIDHYNGMLKYGVCPEQARMVLPQSMYTEFVETGSLAAYARLCKQRLDNHAQKEIQYYAEAVSKLINPLFPKSWEAL
jgi:thymidylate synthase (FAD)